MQVFAVLQYQESQAANARQIAVSVYQELKDSKNKNLGDCDRTSDVRISVIFVRVASVCRIFDGGGFPLNER